MSIFAAHLTLQSPSPYLIIKAGREEAIRKLPLNFQCGPAFFSLSTRCCVYHPVVIMACSGQAVSAFCTGTPCGCRLLPQAHLYSLCRKGKKGKFPLPLTVYWKLVYWWFLLWGDWLRRWGSARTVLTKCSGSCGWMAQPWPALCPTELQPWLSILLLREEKSSSPPEEKV